MIEEINLTKQLEEGVKTEIEEGASINSSPFDNYDVPKYSEDYARYANSDKTELQKLSEKIFSEVDDNLELTKNYKGRIKKIFLDDSSRSKYKSINIVYELNDDGIQKYTRDSYIFGGEYDEWNLKQLIEYIKKINGLYFANINFSSYESIVDSLQFLIDADVVLYQYLTSKGTIKNNVTIIGSYNRFDNTICKEGKPAC